ncbi:inorganic diphosphatase [Kushneria phosphatilytica]|uniref:inorganic diphosphatase n=1 Tax=Kushneria phosphatilytica TaxID=657387 RepID=A0A1S1NTB8_9GAMM|nr:inorganic diphosphatase [Kushneria phosphatilytica]OHV08710.1 hypothetical protein BH688_11830 [Kushneria phosphatilytica]QEL12431.1 inorganic diphosphatase [Kushneria phosphatilytica]
MMPMDAVNSMAAVDDSGDINVIIETPKGSRQKYDLDHSTGLFQWSLELPEAMLFPFSFGFIPGTLGPDGDPMDVILLLDGAVPPGTLVKSRLIGVLELEQDEDGEMVRNDRLIAVANLSRAYAGVDRLEETREGLAWDIEQFFLSYNRMLDREMNVHGYEGPKAAQQLLEGGRSRS